MSRTLAFVALTILFYSDMSSELYKPVVLNNPNLPYSALTNKMSVGGCGFILPIRNKDNQWWLDDATGFRICQMDKEMARWLRTVEASGNRVRVYSVPKRGRLKACGQAKVGYINLDSLRIISALESTEGFVDSVEPVVEAGT
jgi:hypothetical protein